MNQQRNEVTIDPNEITGNPVEGNHQHASVESISNVFINSHQPHQIVRRSLMWLKRWLLKACFLDYQRVPHFQKFPNWKSKVPAVNFEEEIEGNLSSMSSEDKQEVHIDLYLDVFDQADDDRTNDSSGNTRGFTEEAEPISNSWKATSRASAHPQRTLFHGMWEVFKDYVTQKSGSQGTDRKVLKEISSNVRLCVFCNVIYDLEKYQERHASSEHIKDKAFY
ncbi:hypothetical protein DAPPUDRAFT_332777 [Daphnia pulex]|uniref:Uncharacterized protein n=1 Tax=Daphnia pulex TaxID=6669 RepID=E9HQY1_DAPPU|nr:hypothetical protein DAPPUDRAFT_332777 [Daphnia pulex]|eukprot:EFX65860.1 hypothetical protein DAPPUDRAFT_332777 [Daphnia pulex]